MNNAVAAFAGSYFIVAGCKFANYDCTAAVAAQNRVVYCEWLTVIIAGADSYDGVVAVAYVDNRVGQYVAGMNAFNVFNINRCVEVGLQSYSVGMISEILFTNDIYAGSGHGRIMIGSY